MFKIKELEREHNRSGFDCGNNALNSYLKNIARQYLNKGISRTFVIFDDQSPNVILGFYTLAACEIHADKLPRKYAKNSHQKFRLRNWPGLLFQNGASVRESVL